MSELKITQNSLQNAILQDSKLVIGSAEANSSISTNATGAIAHGKAICADSYINAHGIGSIAHGYVYGTNSYIKSHYSGSIANGKTEGKNSFILTEYSVGGIAHGLTEGNNSFIKSEEAGTIAYGKTHGSNSYIYAYGSGGVARGYTYGTNSYIKTYGRGSTAHGKTENENTYIYASGNGGVARGYTYGTNSYIKSECPGSNAYGVTYGENSYILASDSGAVAGGVVYHDGYYIESSGEYDAAYARGCAYAGNIIASGKGAHAEGCAIDGYNIEASGNGACAIGYNVIAHGHGAHAEGYNLSGIIKSSSNGAHTEGYSQYGCIEASAFGAHAEGYAYGATSYIIASGMGAHAEGYASYAKIDASGNGAHAEGVSSHALNNGAHAEGNRTYAKGSSSHAEGYHTYANGNYSHAEGCQTTVSGNYSHAEGYLNNVNELSIYTHIENFQNNTLYNYSDSVHAVSFGSAYSAGDNIIYVDSIGYFSRGDKISIQWPSYPGGKELMCEVEKTEENPKRIFANTSLNDYISYTDHLTKIYKLTGPQCSHIEGYNNFAIAPYSHIEGYGYTIKSRFYYYSNSDASPSSRCGRLYSEYEWGTLDALKGSDEWINTFASGNVAKFYIKAYNDNNVMTYYKIENVGWVNIHGGYAISLKGYGDNGFLSYKYKTKETAQTITCCLGGFANQYCSHITGYGVYSNEAYSTTVGRFNAPEKSGYFIVGNGDGNNLRDNGLRVTATNVYGKAYSTGGADYAEYFEWSDGNPNNEDRRGYFVAIGDDGKIVKSTNIEDTIGVISSASSIVGNSDDDEWHDRFLKDVYGKPIYVMDPSTNQEHKVINPKYNSLQKYIPRSERNEWDIVGLMGQLVVNDDGTCLVGKCCGVTSEGIATNTSTGFKVLKRLDETHIMILMK